MSLLNLSSYGSQILRSGDLVVKDVTSSSQHRVDTESSTHSAYVLDPQLNHAQEATREKHTFNEENNSGMLTYACLRSDGEFPIMATTLETDPGKTTITTNETSATLSKGLSFNSDESAIYFGANKIFRLKYESEAPERLVFQYLEQNTSEYVTKFSCAKN